MRRPDPHKSFWLFASGKKNSGKSRLCRAWFDAYPLDRVVIDPTGDIRRDLQADGVDFIELEHGNLPVRLPEPKEGQTRVTCVFVPDVKAPDYVDEMDRVVGLCLTRGARPVLLWIDEWGSLTTAHKTPPNTRVAVHQGRHHDLSLLLCCPRPQHVEPLGISQADAVATFRTPNIRDRDVIAGNIGFDPAEFSRHNRQHCGSADHAYTLYDAGDDVLYLMPPLPAPKRSDLPAAPDEILPT